MVPIEWIREPMIRVVKLLAQGYSEADLRFKSKPIWLESQHFSHSAMLSNAHVQK